MSQQLELEAQIKENAIRPEKLNLEIWMIK